MRDRLSTILVSQFGNPGNCVLVVVSPGIAHSEQAEMQSGMEQGNRE